MPIRSAPAQPSTRAATTRTSAGERPIVDDKRVGDKRVGDKRVEDKPAASDAFEAAPKTAVALAPFPEHYAASKKVPSLPAGKPTVDTFDEPQLRALHRAYWSAPATASLGDMAALAFTDPAFKGRKMDATTERQIGRAFDKLPESFPWGWRSRTLAATSHVLVDALLRAPVGTAVTTIIEALQKKDPQFPGIGGFQKASREAWIAEPSRFPFVKKHLENQGGKSGYKIEARGAAPAIRKDHLGRFVMNQALAEKVRELSTSPLLDYGAARDDFVKLIDKEIGGGGAFTDKSLGSIRTAFPDIVPDFNVMRAAWRENVARTIHTLYHDEGITDAADIIRTMHERFGTPLWKRTMLTWFRNEFPALVPEFRAEKFAGAYADARALLDAILANPDTPRLHVGRALGHNDQRTGELLAIVARRWPEEFETRTVERFSDADVKALRQAMDDVPLNATMRDLLQVLQREHPEFLERHPYATPESLYSAVLAHGGLEGIGDGTGQNGWNARQQARYVALLVSAVKRSRPGTSLKEIVHTLLDEHEGAYSLSNVLKLVAAARGKDGGVPSSLAPLAALRDRAGEFPWDKAKVKLTHALAQRVGDAIHAARAKKPDSNVIDVVRALKKDAAFMKENPTFSHAHVHHLRARYPQLVPYVDEGPPTKTRERRVDAQRRELLKIAKDVAKVANALDDTSGLTIANLARTVGQRPHRVLAAIRRAPELFPWYRERPTGVVDLHLATKVAHAIESAPLGTTLEQIVDRLLADKGFRARYPQFNYFSLSRVRDRYPELVPEVHARNQILRSKILVDAIVTAKKGTRYADVFAAVSRAHPGQFPERWASEDYVKALWAGEPQRYPFTSALHARSASAGLSLVGRGEKIVRDKTAAPDEVLATQLARLEQIPESLTVLDKLVEGFGQKSKPFADTEILAIQHLLGPQVAMFDAARKLGMTPGRSSIVGIPYSVSTTVVDTLEDKGFDVRVPPLDLEAWYDMVKDAMEERIASALKHGRKIVVFDDGGLVPMMFERWPHLAEHAHLFRIVEQTTRGITVADGVDLHSPVVNVAQSWAKYVEGPMVGSTVQQKLLRRLAGIGVDDIKGKHVGINGFGTIGAPLAEFLRAQGAIVTVMDVGGDGLQRARAAGFDVVDGNDAKARAKYFGKQDILVGATGHRSMTADDIEHMKDGAILGSSSSKLVEIDVETLKELAKRGRIEAVDAESFPPTVRYHLKDGRTIDLLASGFPMNFDGSVEDVAAERIQLTMGLMLAGALQAAGVSAAGLHRLDPSIQLEMLREFHDDVREDLDDAQGRAVEKAMTLAQTHLRELERKHGAHAHDLRHRR